MSQPVATSTPLYLQRGFSLLLTIAVGVVLFAVYFGQLSRTAAADSETISPESATSREPAQNAANDVARNSRSVAWGDVDGDGDLDLAVGNGQDFDKSPRGNRANYILRYENGRLIERIDIPRNNRRDTRSVAWGDWDGDGDLDLAVGNYGDRNQVYKNENGSLVPA